MLLLILNNLKTEELHSYLQIHIKMAILKINLELVFLFGSMSVILERRFLIFGSLLGLIVFGLKSIISLTTKEKRTRLESENFHQSLAYARN